MDTKNSRLQQECENLFELICKGTITEQMIARAFSNLKVKGYNYSDIKTALLNAGDIEPKIETDIYTRADIMHLFNWQDKALRNNLQAWELPHLRPTYKKEVIHQAAVKAGWRYNEPYGAWQRVIRKFTPQV